MIKKIISAVLVCAFGVSLFGCGSSEEVQMQEAKEVVADYFEDLKSAQFDKASDYVSSDYKHPLLMGRDRTGFVRFDVRDERFYEHG